ncbi:hypothetical protein COEREDRAFT_11545 [Coemansia reversa NRRL 1564]|uniref:F-box domain-containing protein n=1 Tax=Coemansia reversa (strain ATCC 12441 / NRRL 1564) TaxID=763665 RepID=A0A2G5B2T7_COERN|nr:hypothetical protein COEREDRAFT_11545 [Coemansia reversa NRRL 1564]|eukprot:PIA13316.1 hypothetical protein COEREDRAFT_11545 [Coemansia reversa NRRL 1564]
MPSTNKSLESELSNGTFNFPPKVLSTILSYLITNHLESLDEWKLQLPLLSICQKWRDAALPLVYHSIFISCSNRNNLIDADDSTFYDKDPSNAQFNSNIDLLVKLGYFRNVRGLSLFMDYQMGLIPFITKVQKFLRIVSPSWDHIVSLHAEVKSKENSDTVLQNASLSSLDTAVELAKNFKVLLPNLTSLHMNAVHGDRMLEDKVCRKFSSVLINEYADQLIRSSCFIRVNLNSPRFSKQLTHVVLRLSPNTKVDAPWIYPWPLVHLYITDTVKDSLWKAFYSKSDKNEITANIEFDHLRYLGIMASEEGSPSSDNPIYSQLFFPKLSHLTVNFSKQSANLLSQSHIPDKLDKFEVIGFSIGSICIHQANIKLDSRKRIAEFAKNDSQNCFWAMTNYLFGSDEQICEHSELLITNAASIPSSDNLKWTYLSQLEIVSGLQADYLLLLIPQLQNMCELIVHKLDFSPIPATVTNADARQLPFNKSITILRINYEESETNNEHALLFIKLLLPHLPAIEELFMPHFGSGFYAFVKEYAATYPHIAGFIPQNE